MNISELSLRRPVLAIVMNIIIVLFGVIGFKFLGIRDYPAIDPPNISVRTAYPEPMQISLSTDNRTAGKSRKRNCRYQEHYFQQQ
jgi:hypothetical protein